MSLTRKCLDNPAVVAVVVAVVFLVGIFSVAKLPLQLFPTIERPQVGIQTSWRAASPQEVESEILEPLEEVLRGIPGLEQMSAFANPGGGFINLEFSLTTDMNSTKLDIISRLNRIRPLPADADQPRLIFGDGGGSNETLSFFFIQQLPGNERPIEDYQQWVQDFVVPRVEAVPGVAGTIVGQGQVEEEVQIVFDPFLAAQYGIDLSRLTQTVGRSNDVSGGFLDSGRRRYTLRFEGRRSLEEFVDQILEWRDGSPVRLGDIAEVSIGRGRDNSVVYQNGNPAIGMRILRESGANVLTTLDGVKEVLWELRDGPMKEKGISVEQSFDASVFIKRAIALLTNNLLIGVLLAIGVLWFFLRQIRATIMIALTIPVCLLTTFIVLQLFGRTLNVISLAGLAFAVGMVLDAAIVVLENIVRLRERGEEISEASEKGATQVWGALLASTITTVAIFTPIIFLKDVEGQLFADLALTIAIGVFASLIVAVTVLPTAARLYLRDLPDVERQASVWRRLSATIMRLTETPKRRIAWIAGLMSVPVIVTFMLMPSLNYLPPVKRDAVDGFIAAPPGASGQYVKEEIAEVVVERLQPYMDGTKEPALKNYYVITFDGGGGLSVGIRAKDQSRIKELENIVNDEIISGFPDTFANAQQGNLFGGFGDTGSVNLHIQSVDNEAAGQAALLGQRLAEAAMPGSRVRVNPYPEQSNPELRITPIDDRIREAGFDRSDIARIVRALGDGLWLSEYFNGEKRLDVILKAQASESPEDLMEVPIITRTGAIVPLGELVDIERTVGPGGIRRVDGRRTFTLDINPPDGMSLGDALKIVEAEVEPQIRAALPADGSIRYGGSANSLKQAVRTMGQNFLFAILLLFLILAALFRSMRDALLVVISIPLATVGGIAALRFLNLFTFQPMDLLTMIGFIILLGLVVNNAILLVHQTRQGEAEGLDRREAVQSALQVRMRPIFMSTLTSIFGMLPLVVIPGAGSAIYRGMATTIVGGMCVSTLFTLILLPSLLRLGESSESWSDIQSFFKKLRKPQTQTNPAE